MAITLYPNSKSVRPSVNITTDTDNLVGSSTETAKQLMLVGMANGGEPAKPYKITTYAQAKSIFRGGDLLDAIEVALSPSATEHSGTIWAERVGNATQATFKNNGLSITSKSYSVEANNIQTSLVKNTLNDTYNLSVNFDLDGHYKTYTNLGKIAGIYYTGSQAYAEVSIETDKNVGDEKHTGFATKLVLKAGADKDSASLVHEFPLAQGQYGKVNKLISDINSIAGFSANYFYSGNKNIETKYLDGIEAQEISKDSTKPTYLTSLGGDIVLSLANEADEAISAEYDPSLGEPEPYELANLTGGTSSELPPTSWIKEFRNLATVPAYYLVPLTDDISIQQETSAFCADRNREADPRAVIVGGGYNDTLDYSINRASNLKSLDVRVAVNAISGYRLMNNGTVQHLPAYLIAAQMGGLATGLDLGESITYKPLNLSDIDQKFTADELDRLDENGVIAVEYVRNRASQMFRVTNDITTARALGSKAPERTELGAGEAIDFLVVNLRAEIEDKFIGTSTSLTSAADIKTCIISFLQQEQNTGIIQDYNEADIHVVVNGERVDVQITCQLSRAIKEVNIGIIFTDKQVIA